jgi:glycosyltransferase involved in cell wall biosynthesis
MPRVSVLMPVYNTIRYVRSAVRSVQGQRYGDWELVVIDDGSTDGSSGELDSIAATEPRMRLIRRPNKGLVATRNQLLDEARGEFIAWMDSDDLSHPERLERQLAAFDGDPACVCVGTDVRLIDPAGKPLGIEQYPTDDAAIRAEQTSGGGLRFGSSMQKRSAALAADGFRGPFPMGEDFDFLLRIAEQGSLANVPHVLYDYRQHLLNTCSAYGGGWDSYRRIIIDLAVERRKLGSDKLQRGEPLDLPVVDRHGERAYRPFVLLEWARGAMASGDRRRAIKFALKAVAAAPSKGLFWRYLVRLLTLRS